MSYYLVLRHEGKKDLQNLQLIKQDNIFLSNEIKIMPVNVELASIRNDEQDAVAEHVDTL